METQMNVDNLFIAKNVARSVAAGTRVTLTDLADGEIVWVTPDGRVVDNSSPDAASFGTLRLVARSGNDLLFSDDIPVKNISHYSVTAYAAPTEQITYVGYNGTSGALDTTVSTLYFISLIMDGYFAAEYNQQKIIHGSYKSGATTTQKAIAEGLAQNLVANFKNAEAMRRDYVKCDMICNATVTSANTLQGTTTVVEGDNYVVSNAAAQVETITLTGTSGTANVAAAGGLTKTATFGTSLTASAAAFVVSHAAAYLAVGIVVTSSGANIIMTASVPGTAFTAPTITNATGDLAGSIAHTTPDGDAGDYGTTLTVVGDYLRIGTNGSSTALTDPIYRVTAISGSDTAGRTITLDRAVTQPSGTYTADTSVEVIPAATAASADYGIKLLGVANTWTSPAKDVYYKVRFTTVIDGFTSALVTESQGAYEGSGTYWQIAELEWFLQGNEGGFFRTNDFFAPAPVSRAQVTSGTTWDILKIGFTTEVVHDITKAFAKKWVTIAMDTTSNNNNQIYDASSGTNTEIVTVADDWIVTSWGIAGCTAQVSNLT